METASTPTDSRPGFLAIEFQHTELEPVAGPVDPAGPTALLEYEDLLGWAQRYGGLSDGDARALRRAARSDPGSARRAFDRALQLRQTLDAVFRAIADGAQPPATSTMQLSTAEVDALAHGQVVPRDGGFGWAWIDATSLERPLWPVIHDAMELLLRGPLERVKACGGCRYLFIDESKNRSRRWCSMSTCGTHEKVRRYVARRAARRAT